MKPPDQRRTIHLTERIASTCQLLPAEVNYLGVYHRTHLEIVPAGDGDYRITPAGYVGLIVGPTFRLHLQPKIPADNLWFLLEPWSLMSAVSHHPSTQPGETWLNVLAGWFAQLLHELVKRGLYRSYRPRPQEGPFLAGRLDVATQLRRDAGRKEKLHCLTDDLTTDLPCNRVLKAVAEAVIRAPVNDSVVAFLRQSLPAFAAVSSMPRMEPAQFLETTHEIPALRRHPYTRLLNLAQFLAEGSAESSGGALGCCAFLVNMERVFERYITWAVQAAFRESIVHGVRVQHAYGLTRREDADLAVQVRPDITVERSGVPDLIVDAKWKDATPATNDLYQVIAYCAGLGAKRAVLVYPGSTHQVRRLRFRRTPLVVDLCRIRVSGSRVRCRRSMERFQQLLRQWAHGKRSRTDP